MKAVEITEVAALLESYNKADRPLLLTRNGQPIAALFPVGDVDIETLSLGMNSKFISIIHESRESQKEAGRIFLEDLQIP